MKPKESEEQTLDFREEQIKNALAKKKWSYLELHYETVHMVGPFELTCFDATLCSEDGSVWQAWIIKSEGMLNVCNRDSFPTVKNAICYHISVMWFEGKVDIVLPTNETATRTQD